VYLGRYPEEEDAARKYDEAAREHHGSRAVLNFLTEEDIRAFALILKKLTKRRHRLQERVRRRRAVRGRRIERAIFLRH